MLDKAFQFDITKWQWVECSIEYVILDVSKIPLHVVYQFWDKDNLKYRYAIWDNDNKCMIEVTAGKTPDSLIDNTGKNHRGLFAVVYNYAEFSQINTIETTFLKDMPFRWRIFQRKQGMPLLLAVDCVTMDRATKRNGYRQKNIITDYQYSFLIAQNKYIVNNSDRYVPPPVYKIVLEAMQEDIIVWKGKSPTFTAEIKHNYTTNGLMAVFEKPYAPLVVFLKPFIGERFNELFHRETKNDFDILTRVFNIKPLSELRTDYEENPYSIVIYLLMRQFGFTDYNHIRRFFYFSKSIFGIELSTFRYDWKNKRIKLKDYHYSYYRRKNFNHGLEDIKFFIKWLIREQNDEYAANYMWRALMMCTEQYKLSNFLSLFRNYFDIIDNKIKERLLREGLTIHLMGVLERNVAKKKIYDSIKSNGRAQNNRLNVVINDYNFYVLCGEESLSHIIRELHHEELTEYSLDNVGDIFLVSISKGGKFVACIEMRPCYYDRRRFFVNSIYGDYHLKPAKEILDAAVYWTKLYRLDVGSDILKKTECIWYDDSKFCRHKSDILFLYNRLSLDLLQPLINIPDEYADAYYHTLALRLNESDIPKLSMPSFLIPKSELEYLMYVFPQGENIFKAAIKGVARAQYELAIFYQNGRFFPSDLERMHYWFEKSAQGGLSEAMWQMAVFSILGNDLDKAQIWLKQLSLQTGIFGCMAKIVSFLLAENALSIKNVMGCMQNFQSKG